MNILHISDLHFGSQDDARTWAGQLAEDLSGGLNCKRLDALIVSGAAETRNIVDAHCRGMEGIERLAAGARDPEPA